MIEKKECMVNGYFSNLKVGKGLGVHVPRSALAPAVHLIPGSVPIVGA